MYNVHQLCDAIAHELDQLAARFLRKLVASMRKGASNSFGLMGVTHTIEKAVKFKTHSTQSFVTCTSSMPIFKTTVSGKYIVGTK